jgi:tetraacyldisaccharide 4'-kinase
LNHLRERGLRAGLVSRGYARTSTGCQEVTPSSAATDAGDEPLLVARRCQVPVFVASDRTEAARALRAAYPATQVIVSDDGLQHYALARDIEICVFDQRGIGNGWLLPAGPLREPWPRPVDLIVLTGSAAITGFRAQRRLEGHAYQRDGTQVPLQALAGRRLKAVAGIGRPAAFFDMLRAAGLTLQEAVALPDHHPFDQPVAPPDGCELICTEKDAVKLWRLQPQAWAVPMALHIEPAFWTEFDALLNAKLSSRHGFQTA